MGNGAVEALEVLTKPAWSPRGHGPADARLLRQGVTHHSNGLVCLLLAAWPDVDLLRCVLSAIHWIFSGGLVRIAVPAVLIVGGLTCLLNGAGSSS